MSEVEIQSVRYRHEAIADMMLGNPDQTQGWIAQRLGYSEPWLSVVIHSTLFKEYFRDRRLAHEKTLREKITGAQLEVTLSALQRLKNIIESDGTDGRLILDTAERVARQCGFEPRQLKITEEREVTFPVPAHVLADARARMTRRIERTETSNESEGLESRLG